MVINNMIDGNVKKMISGKSKEELQDILEDIISHFPDAWEYFESRQVVSGGNLKKAVEKIKKDIRTISSEPGWKNYWRHDGYTPDYSSVRARLDSLLKDGYADDVLDIGKELLEKGIEQIEMSNDEGETADEIAECVNIVFKALAKSSLPEDEKILAAINMHLEDSYGICEGSGELLQKSYRSDVWSSVADKLMKKMSEYPPSKTDFSDNYHRDRLTDWIINTLENAKRKDEIIPLCEQEAKYTSSYNRLVKRLIDNKNYKDAETWIYEGITKTQDKAVGIASCLRNKFRELREKEHDWPVVSAIKAEDFFHSPSLSSFQDLLKAASKTEYLAEVRTAAMQYLETGNKPKRENWPLPKTGLPEVSEKRSRWDVFPQCNVLIEIAITEKKPDQVIRWYEIRQKKTDHFYYYGKEDEIAAAVAKAYPEKAIAIWEKISEKLIAETKPASYEQAGRYLRKLKALLIEEGKGKQWSDYSAELRNINKRKIRFVEILDKIT